MFFLLYFILNKAALTDLNIISSSNSIIRPEAAELQNLGINIQESNEKLGQLKASEKILRDSIKFYEEENNKIKEKVVTNKDYKLYRKKWFFLADNFENLKETYDKNVNFVLNFKAPLIDNGKKASKVIINEKNKEVDISKFSNGGIRKKRSVEDKETTVKNVFSTYPPTIITTTSIKDLNEDTTVVNLNTTNPSIKNNTTKFDNLYVETTKTVVLKTKDFLKSFLQKKIDEDTELYVFLDKNFDIVNFDNYYKNSFIIPENYIVNLKFFYLLNQLKRLTHEINNQINKDNIFYGFDDYCRNISNVLGEKAAVDNGIICMSFEKIYYIFYNFFVKVKNLNNKMTLLELLKNENLKKYEKYNIFANYSIELNDTLQNLYDMKKIMSEKIMELYDKKNKLRKIICDSFVYQYKKANNDLNIYNFCLEHHVCENDLELNKSSSVKKYTNNAINARKNAIACFENQQNATVAPILFEKYRNNTNIDSIIKTCGSQTATKDEQNKSNQYYFRLLLNSVLFYGFDFNIKELVFFKTSTFTMIDDFIIKLQKYNTNHEIRTMKPKKKCFVSVNEY